MSEAGPVRGVVIAHGDMARGLVDAVAQISGVADDALIPVSNRGLSPDGIVDALRPFVGEGRVVVFTDMPGGSCALAARRISRDLPGVTVVCGVNLPLLLDFVTHRDMPVAELIPRILARGRDGITSAPAHQEAHGDRAVPSR